MSKTKIMDGHEYFLREDGLWEAKEKFLMRDVDWTYSGLHDGHTCLFVYENDVEGWPKLVCDTKDNFKTIVSIQSITDNAWLMTGLSEPGDFIGGNFL